MILSALNTYYDRLAEQGNTELAPYGFSQEKISYALVINPKGELVDVVNLMDTSGKKPRPSMRQVSQPPKRAVNIAPCFLWDKTGYVLGVTAGETEKERERTRKTHDAFKAYHHEWIGDSDDEGLVALLAFLDQWQPDGETRQKFITEDMLDSNLVFQLEGDAQRFIHERPAAKAIRAKQLASAGGEEQMCLVTGEVLPAVTLHPSIKGVNGAQSSGASLVSFNLDAFTSHHKKQGMNAPVSDKAAFAYGTALNYLLRRSDDNRQRVNIGDTTVVFWAEAETAQQAQAAEAMFAGIFSSAPVIDKNKSSATADESEHRKLASAFSQLAQGKPLQEIGTDLKPDTKIYVLGLAPNAARLSVRFWETSTLDQFAKRLAQHYQDMLMEPLPWKTEPSIWRLINETVPHRPGAKPKQDDASPHLAGELARAILTGQRYPHSLLANLIMRFRADGDISSLRVALCKAVLVRKERLTHSTSIQPTEESHHKELFVSLDIENQDPGYLLGRLFAVLEAAQEDALGRDINATIRDRYYGAASATPASVFPLLLRNAQNHLGKVRKDRAGQAVNLEKLLIEIIDKLDSNFAKSLGLEAQGRFAIGYYHQRSERFKKKSKPDNNVNNDQETTEGHA
ncbi:MAG: type I-C CRISPR-associated protein Cas8c/Csd1 [Oceanobacter sp.]